MAAKPKKPASEAEKPAEKPAAPSSPTLDIFNGKTPAEAFAAMAKLLLGDRA